MMRPPRTDLPERADPDEEPPPVLGHWGRWRRLAHEARNDSEGRWWKLAATSPSAATSAASRLRGRGDALGEPGEFEVRIDDVVVWVRLMPEGADVTAGDGPPPPEEVSTEGRTEPGGLVQQAYDEENEVYVDIDTVPPDFFDDPKGGSD